jgi:predicted amidohydrolase YtcJ
MRTRYARERFRPDCVKIVLDGVPTDSHTAAMVEDYGSRIPGRDDEAARRGMLLVAAEEVNRAVTDFDRSGLTVKFHAAGDAAVRAGLDAIAAARTANGPGGPRHDIAHCTFVHPQDVARGRALGATFEVSPYLWSPTPINRDISAAIADARMLRVWPVRELVESGALVTAGSDWSVVPSVSPWIGIETLVTREEPGGSRESFGKAGAITLTQAFALFTQNAARHEGVQDRRGVLAPGMDADFVVIDRDPWAVPLTEVHRTKVLQTWIAGEKVYAMPAAKL